MPIKNIDDAILKDISVEEGVEVEFLKRGIMHGRIILPMNVKRNRVKPIAIGEGLRTKVNVNIGTSGSVSDIDMEVEKARVAAIYGADTVMDLSTGGNIDEIRRSLIEASRPLPFGTVPVYQAWIEGVKKYGSAGIPSDWFISTVEQHLRDGVDFMTIHAGISKELAKKAIKSMRIMPIVSRGGSMIAVWMLENNEENPYLQHWDYLIELFKEYNAVISLGDALRPGTVVDAFDALQIEELVNNAKLARDAVSKGVQVMIEGPGHMTLEKIAADVKLMKSLSGRVPYYVLGPLVTDIAVGYDHIAAAIGAAVAAANGADIICYLTPSEHLSLPNVEQVKEGLIAAKIAAHAGDLIKLGERAVKRDVDMSLARARLDWNTQIALSFDREKARSIKTQFGETERSCSMCGQYCVFILLEKYLGKREGVKLDDILARVLKGVTL